jgi:hypothetical protein
LKLRALPQFEGRQPLGAQVRLTGSSDQHVGALEMDETVYFVVKGHVTRISHQDGKISGAEVFVRNHTVKASQVILLDPNDGERMLDEAAMLSEDAFSLNQMFKAAGVDPNTGEMS